jgi:thiol-disulfide isomerase/thioredoxin
MRRGKQVAVLCILVQVVSVCVAYAQRPLGSTSQPAGKNGVLAPPPHPMVGKPAPVFKAEVLGGGTLDLAKSKGKNVVLLDFWATWCPPCRMSMPIVDRVAKRYADKGVLAYAVNLREDQKTIEQFLKSNPLEVKVAMDKEGTIAGQYGIEGIPFIVVIDKDGVVRAVYEGIGPNLEKDLTKDLDKLVTDKKAPASQPAVHGNVHAVE